MPVRRNPWRVALAVAVVVGPGVVWTVLGFASRPSGPARSPDPACAPWSQCPTADWLRSVLLAAGYTLSADTPGSLVASGEGHHDVHVWVTEAQAPLAEVATREGYRPFAKVAGAVLYSDGQRTVWGARGLSVWLQPAEAAGSNGRGVESLVRSSLRTPRPAAGESRALGY